MVFAVALLFMVFYLNLSLLKFIATNEEAAVVGRKILAISTLKQNRDNKPTCKRKHWGGRGERFSSTNRKEKQGTRIKNVFETSKNRQFSV